jgi:hypothetical protein
MKLGALLKIGAFLISGGILMEENENERFGGRVAQGVLRHFCFNRSGKRKKFFTKI